MVSPHSPQPAQLNHHNTRTQAGAIKVFEEAGGALHLFVPGVGEKYEDLAADFLENWLVNDTQNFQATPEPKSSTLPIAEKEIAPTWEATFTNFSLDLEEQFADPAMS